MKGLVLVSVICLQLGWSHAKGHSAGVGAFSSQDSSGARYEGTYSLRDGEVVDVKGNFPPGFSPPTHFEPPTFYEPDNFIGFFPEYFRNLENLLQDPGFTYYAPTPQVQYIPPQTYSYPRTTYNRIPDYGLGYNTIPDYSTYGPNFNNIPNYDYYNQNTNRAFQANLESQNIALDAAHKAFDLTSNQAGYSPNLNPSRLGPINEFPTGFPAIPAPMFPPGFPFEGGIPMPNLGSAASSAFAGASVGPGFKHQVAAISPGNPESPNVFKSESVSSNPGGFKSVSVSSYSSSADINGRKTSTRGSKTMINDNGKVTSYSVHSR